MTNKPSAVILTDIQKSYRKHTIFENLNLKINEHELTTIFGKSGAGKSTILNMIGLLEPFDAGKLILFGKPAPKVRSSEALKLRRYKISYLFQNFGLIDDGTISQNLDVGLAYVKGTRKDKQLQKQQVLKDVQLNCPLKTKIYTLSGGEQQRVAVARLLLKPANLILADELTGALDSENRSILGKLLLKLRDSGKTVIVVSHDRYFEKISDQVINLADLK
ncbi:ATP-binding cassette domain-containing protein [Levilactobacillus parabrevis]|uniref:ABC superfamily ATP binding cassette transporter ABC protein n=1 Tax=Levilactobacillus parabrevis ATCC 53295 TaxID=1267003 RepID=A0A0R1GQ99_9LACO|nr:ATP-binding cassette domain-containing protein [Levilactobacillus parabrevis]KRK33079.1 ABC superfamily ATP binding cassette transporter ABC protein [Levilactobacillus parabrevis ATCC 53295]KRO04209.1 ABC superfamily ATP binding cassette transporter ABC protein [Levilactobacillus parabrevis]